MYNWPDILPTCAIPVGPDHLRTQFSLTLTSTAQYWYLGPTAGSDLCRLSPLQHLGTLWSQEGPRKGALDREGLYCSRSLGILELDQNLRWPVSLPGTFHLPTLTSSVPVLVAQWDSIVSLGFLGSRTVGARWCTRSMSTDVRKNK